MLTPQCKNHVRNLFIAGNLNLDIVKEPIQHIHQATQATRETLTLAIRQFLIQSLEEFRPLLIIRTPYNATPDLHKGIKEGTVQGTMRFLFVVDVANKNLLLLYMRRFNDCRHNSILGTTIGIIHEVKKGVLDTLLNGRGVDVLAIRVEPTVVARVTAQVAVQETLNRRRHFNLIFRVMESLKANTLGQFHRQGKEHVGGQIQRLQLHTPANGRRDLCDGIFLDVEFFQVREATEVGGQGLDTVVFQVQNLEIRQGRNRRWHRLPNTIGGKVEDLQGGHAADFIRNLLNVIVVDEELLQRREGGNLGRNTLEVVVDEVEEAQALQLGEGLRERVQHVVGGVNAMELLELADFIRKNEQLVVEDVEFLQVFQLHEGFRQEDEVVIRTVDFL